LPMLHMLRQMLVGIFVALVVLLPAAFVLDAMFAGQFRAERMALLPPQLRDAEIIYETDTGFAPGPGGNEAGIIVYALDESILPSVIDIAFFPPAQPGWQPWEETPAPAFPRWHIGADAQPSLNAFLGVDLEIVPELYEAVDDSINAPGSYLTHRGLRSFMLIVPSQARAYYVYSDYSHSGNVSSDW